MDRFEIGMLARSKAGHDKGHVYVILQTDETYVYLTDGSNRKTDNPKRKKRKHVQPIFEKYDLAGMDNVAIKRILKLWNQETGRN